MGDWGQGAQGAIGGGMTGASLGSAAGPWGTAIGGGIGLLAGGLSGYLGGDPQGDQQKRLQDAWNNRGANAPQMGAAAQSANSPYEQNRGALIAQLQAMASGKGPSLAMNQMRNAMGQNTANQNSLASGAAGRGVNPGAAYMQASNSSAAQNAQAMQTGANGRVQEEYNAQGLLSNTLGTAIGQNNQNSQFNASAQNAQMMANLQAKLSTMGLNQAQTDALLQMFQQAQGNGMGTALLAGGVQAGANWAGRQQAGAAAPQGSGSGPYGGTGPGVAGYPGGY